MVDNYLPVYRMERQIETEPKKQIEKHLNIIIDDINNKKQAYSKDLFIMKLPAKYIWQKNNPYKIGVGITSKFRIENTCNKCGICAKVCPTDNIKAENTEPAFSNNCITCLACTHNCPNNAIRLSTEKSKARFRNQHITLKEIIDSNNH